VIEESDKRDLYGSAPVEEEDEEEQLHADRLVEEDGLAFIVDKQ